MSIPAILATKFFKQIIDMNSIYNFPYFWRCQPKDVLDALAPLLDRKSLEDDLKASDPKKMTMRQKANLKTVHNHYISDLKGLQYELIQGTETSQVSPSLPWVPGGKSQNESRDVTASSGIRATGGRSKIEMNKLARDIRLDASFNRYLDLEGHYSIASFLQENVVFGNQSQVFLETKNISAAFQASYTYIQHLSERSVVDKARWAFHMLMIFDLVTLVTHTTGRRLSNRQHDKVRKFITPFFRDPDVVEEVCSNMSKWTRIGIKIDQLCTEFGPGCIFFLARHFSRDFFEHKYREKGAVKESVFGRLHEARLSVKSETTGANRLGQDLREHLIGGFRRCLQA